MLRTQRDFEIAHDKWLDARNPWTNEPDENEEERLPKSYTTKRLGRGTQQTCTCNAYNFPHRAGGGKCENY